MHNIIESRVFLNGKELSLSIQLSSNQIKDHSFLSDHPEVWQQLEMTCRGILELALRKHEVKSYG